MIVNITDQSQSNGVSPHLEAVIGKRSRFYPPKHVIYIVALIFAIIFIWKFGIDDQDKEIMMSGFFKKYFGTYFSQNIILGTFTAICSRYSRSLFLHLSIIFGLTIGNFIVLLVYRPANGPLAAREVPQELLFAIGAAALIWLSFELLRYIDGVLIHRNVPRTPE